MPPVTIHKSLVLGLMLAGHPAAAAGADLWDDRIVQYGTMHEAIGQQRHQGRVQLTKLIETPHIFGVAALARLGGEVTIVDGSVTMTRAADLLRWATGSGRQARMRSHETTGPLGCGARRHSGRAAGGRGGHPETRVSGAPGLPR